jgi:FlaA1/EpsC-like NDP-sugar epimerase
MRPGEKLFEELAVSEEQLAKTLHPKIYIGRIVTYPAIMVVEALARLEELSERGDEQMIRKFLADFLPEASLNVGDGAKAFREIKIRPDPVRSLTTHP